MNALKKSIPLWQVIIAIATIGSVIGAVVWQGSQATTITVPALVKPTITPSVVGLEIPVNTYQEVDLTIANPNNIPILVNSQWTVTINETLIASGYDEPTDLQHFVWVKHISTFPIEEYGIFDGYFEPLEESYPLIIPAEGYVIYTLVYYIPPNFVDNMAETVWFEFDTTVEVEWLPQFTEYIGEFYDGIEEWANPYIPYWYPVPPL